jgi:5-methyltetrahydropteroyltriglutamate--homocysteine methyltransferase
MLLRRMGREAATATARAYPHAADTLTPRNVRQRRRIEMGDVIRAEVVGSMLRPAGLLEARERVASGAITRTEFKRVEDRAVDDAIAVQERAGVQVVTDGELRRLSFLGPLTDTVDGVRPIEGAKVAWHDEEGEKPNLQPAVVERLRVRRSLASEEYAYARGRTALPVKVTLPSPLMLALLWKPGVSTEVYDDPFDCFADAAAIVRAEALALAEMGCPYIQVDAPELATLVDPAQRAFYASIGIPAERLLGEGIELLDEMVKGVDARIGLHLCRGNNAGKWMSEGGYDEISQAVFTGARGYDVFLLEYDDHRSGDFVPLRDVPDDKIVSLGLVTTKHDELETPEALLARIDAAAEHFPREQLSLCTQCGFASVLAGNPIAAQTQERKLRLVAEVAGRAWG